MSLDVFNPIASDQNVAANAAHDLPAGFTEAFDISLRGIGEWNSSTAYNNARDRALATYYDDVKRQTGVQLPLYGMGGNVSIDELNGAIAKLPQAPDQAPQPPLSEDSINGMALARMRRAHQDSRAFESREATWGGTAGTVIGTLTASLADPVAAATLPLGGAGTVPIAVRALEFAAIGAGTEAAIAASNYQSREAAVPGSSKEIPGEIVTAGLFGGVLGGAMGALEKVFGHSARPLPTTVRDEVNAASSELQFHATNPFPTAAGEAAARDATVDATMALIRDLPVRSADDFAASHVADYARSVSEQPADGYARFYHGGSNAGDGPVWLTPQRDYAEGYARNQTEGGKVWFVDIPEAQLKSDPRLSSGFDEINGVYRNFEAPAEIQQQLRAADPALAAKATTPEELAIAGERHLRPGTFDEVPNVERFDRMPGPAEDAAGYWDRRLAEASPEERAALGATDEPGAVPRIHESENVTTAPSDVTARDLTPEQTAQLAAEPATQDAVLHNLDHLVAANPEAEFTTQVRQADGSYQFQTQKLSDVMKEIGEFESAAKELEACVIGLEAAE